MLLTACAWMLRAGRVRARRRSRSRRAETATTSPAATSPCRSTRAGATPGTITLAIRRHRAPVGEARSAIIALAGGPGQPALPFAEAFAELLGPIAATRDLIVFDQRGIGLSDPLSCHAFERPRLYHSVGALIEACGDAARGRRGPSTPPPTRSPTSRRSARPGAMKSSSCTARATAPRSPSSTRRTTRATSKRWCSTRSSRRTDRNRSIAPRSPPSPASCASCAPRRPARTSPPTPSPTWRVSSSGWTARRCTGARSTKTARRIRSALVLRRAPRNPPRRRLLSAPARRIRHGGRGGRAGRHGAAGAPDPGGPDTRWAKAKAKTSTRRCTTRPPAKSRTSRGAARSIPRPASPQARRRSRSAACKRVRALHGSQCARSQRHPGMRLLAVHHPCPAPRRRAPAGRPDADPQRRRRPAHPDRKRPRSGGRDPRFAPAGRALHRPLGAHRRADPVRAAKRCRRCSRPTPVQAVPGSAPANESAARRRCRRCGSRSSRRRRATAGCPGARCTRSR